MAHTFSTEKLFPSRGSSSGISDDAIEPALLSTRRPSRFHSALKHSIVHFALLSVYTAIFFSFWPDVSNDSLQEPVGLLYNVSL